MTRFLEPSFSTMAPPGEAYRENFDRIFGKKDEAAESPAQCDPPSRTYDPVLVKELIQASIQASFSLQTDQPAFNRLHEALAALGF